MFDNIPENLPIIPQDSLPETPSDKTVGLPQDIVPSPAVKTVVQPLKNLNQEDRSTEIKTKPDFGHLLAELDHDDKVKRRIPWNILIGVVVFLIIGSIAFLGEIPFVGFRLFTPAWLSTKASPLLKSIKTWSSIQTVSFEGEAVAKDWPWSNQGLPQNFQSAISGQLGTENSLPISVSALLTSPESEPITLKFIHSDTKYFFNITGLKEQPKFFGNDGQAWLVSQDKNKNFSWSAWQKNLTTYFPWQIDQSSEEILDGQVHYLLKGSLDSKKVDKLITKLEPGFSVPDSLKQAKWSFWVKKDDFYLSKLTIITDTKPSTNLTITFNSVNLPLSINRPAKVVDAPEGWFEALGNQASSSVTVASSTAFSWDEYKLNLPLNYFKLLPENYQPTLDQMPAMLIDTDKDGIPDSLEDALGTDKNSADTDKDSYNDKQEIEGGYNPLGPGKL